MKIKTVALLATITFWLVTVLGAYTWNFGFELSKEQTDWGAFGSYVSGTLTIPFSLFAVYLAYRAYQRDNRQAKFASFLPAISTAMAELESGLNEMGTLIGPYSEVKFRDLITDWKMFEKLRDDIDTMETLHTRTANYVFLPLYYLYQLLRSYEKEFGDDAYLKAISLKYDMICIRICSIQLLTELIGNDEAKSMYYTFCRATISETLLPDKFDDLAKHHQQDQL